MKKHICFLLITALLCSSLSGCVSTAMTSLFPRAAKC